MTQQDYQPDVTAPLDGVRVLDLTRLASGNHFSVVLADMGADVIKVEHPKHGDTLRAAVMKGISTYWKVYGRNKRSITLNLKHPAGREIVLKLCETAHVLAENFTPGTLEKLDLAPATLHERNPALVITRISGWGQTGPYATRPGFGTLAEAVSGFTGLNGYADRPPLPAPYAMADMVAGLYASSATLAALHHASVTGQGQVIDVSLFEPLVSVMGPDAILDRLGEPRQLGEGTKASSVKGVFRTKDDNWIAMSAATPETAARFFHAIGRGDLLEDQRFADYNSRLENRDALNEIIAEFYATMTLDDVMAFITEHRLTAAPVYDVHQAQQDPHFQARQTFVEMPDPDDEMDSVPMHNVVPRFSATPSGLRRPAPSKGQHNIEVLQELGYSEDEIQQFADEGVL